MATELLWRIVNVCHRIVFDDDGEIFCEYEEHIGSDIALRKWFTSMSMYSAKIVSRPRARGAFSVRIHTDDVKFLEVAVNSPHKTIVTNDHDLIDVRNDPEIMGHGIRILTIQEALLEF